MEAGGPKLCPRPFPDVDCVYVQWVDGKPAVCVGGRGIVHRAETFEGARRWAADQWAIIDWKRGLFGIWIAK